MIQKKVPKKHAQQRRKWAKQKDERADFELSNHMQIRTMAPFNIRCGTCGHYTNKGTKIQANVDKFPGMTYLEKIIIWRFHVRCPVCRAVIVFRTDPENSDYDIVSGGTRSFRSAYVRAKQEAEDAVTEKEMQENDPMKILEDRTFASKRELEDVELVEDLMERRRLPGQTDATDVVERKELKEVTVAKNLIMSRLKGDEEEIKLMLIKQHKALELEVDGEEGNDILKPSFKFRIGGDNSIPSKKTSTKKSLVKVKKSPVIEKSKSKQPEPDNEEEDEITDLNQFMNVSSDDKFKIPKLPNIPIKRTAPKVSVPAVKVAKTSGNALGLGAYSDSSDESD